VSVFRNIGITLQMIKWEHSVFALPFALAGAMLAARGLPDGWRLLWIIVAMVAARSAAMAFNRLVDARLDAANPRTRSRALPAGLLSPKFVAIFVIISATLLVFAAWNLNLLAFLLSPFALAIVLLYSFTKRFTRWSHLVLGFALGIAPAAAWIAVRGSLEPRILLLSATVTFWVAGFDVLYACQDYDFDRESGLHSIPRHMGIPRALVVARALHAAMLLLLVAVVHVFGLGHIAMVGVAVVALLVAYEHSLVAPDDLSNLNAAFFTTNGVISVLLFIFIATDLLARR
jgi:4-hydroxybenzoate polyprenyltransferase